MRKADLQELIDHEAHAAVNCIDPVQVAVHRGRIEAFRFVLATEIENQKKAEELAVQMILVRVSA